MFKARTIIIAAVLTLAGGAAVTAASLSSARVAGSPTECSRETWPHISSPCLEGATVNAVRVVTTDRTNADDMAVRFEVAFQ